MSLVVGTRLGSYEVVAPLGAGGMGEVYRARDSWRMAAAPSTENRWRVVAAEGSG